MPMRAKNEPLIARKLTVRTNGRKLVLAKRSGESERHVILNSLIEHRGRRRR